MRPTSGVPETAAVEKVAPRSTSTGRALLEVVRIPQWPKNGLVVAAPLAAGVLARPDVLLDTAVALLAFILASSGTYVLNDVGDVDHDRLHPHKRHRPIARGDLSLPAARVLGVTLLLAAVALPAARGYYLPGLCIAS